jgi:hypothetical protein
MTKGCESSSPASSHRKWVKSKVKGARETMMDHAQHRMLGTGSADSSGSVGEGAKAQRWNSCPQSLSTGGGGGRGEK